MYRVESERFFRVESVRCFSVESERCSGWRVRGVQGGE